MSQFRGQPFVDAFGRSFDPHCDVVWTVTDIRGLRADLADAGDRRMPLQRSTPNRMLRLVANPMNSDADDPAPSNEPIS
jgi:hypothetical protein